MYDRTGQGAGDAGDGLDPGDDQLAELVHVVGLGPDDLVDRLEKFLGYPSHDPHGDPIPGKNGEVLDRPLIPLARLQAGDTGTVERVSDAYPELLRYASSLGLAIKAHIEVVERIAFDCSVRLIASGREAVVSEKLANSVFILPGDPEDARKGKVPAGSRRKRS